MIRLLWSESHDSTAMHGQSTAAKVRLQWLQFCGQWDHVGKDGDRAWNCHVELERLSLIHTSQHIFRTGDISDICISKKKDNYQFLRYVFVIWSTRPGFLFAWRIWPAMAASWARISSPGLFQWECDHRKSQSIVNVWRHILWISNDILEVSWWFNDLLDIIWYYIDLTR